MVDFRERAIRGDEKGTRYYVNLSLPVEVVQEGAEEEGRSIGVSLAQEKETPAQLSKVESLALVEGSARAARNAHRLDLRYCMDSMRH